MENREKCEHIIQVFNGHQIQGAKDPLLVKFADGGPKKKNPFKSPDPNARAWRDETLPVAYDHTLQQNGVSVNVGTPISVPYPRFGAPQVSGYPMPPSQWIPSYMMTQPIAQVEDQVSINQIPVIDGYLLNVAYKIRFQWLLLVLWIGKSELGSFNDESNSVIFLKSYCKNLSSITMVVILS